MPTNFNWLHAMAVSPVFLVLVGCSVVTLTVSLERLFYFAKRKGDPDATLRRALAEISLGELRAAGRTLEASPHPFGAVGASLMIDGHYSEATAERRMHVALSEQKLLLERNVGVLGTMAAIAPLIGLLGTVWGIMRAFHDMALAGAAGPSVVAAGIAEALFTTATGILIAVPALVIHNHFARRVTTLLTVAETHSVSLCVALGEATAESSSGAPRARESREPHPGVPAHRPTQPVASR